MLIAGRSLPDGDLSKDQIDSVRQSAIAHLEQHGIKRKQFALELGRSAPVISDWLAGNYAGRSDDIAREVNGWLEIDARRRRAKVQTNFVMTAVAEALMDVARDISECGSIALAYGPAGIGKSMTAEAIAAEIPGSIYVLVGIDDGGQHGIRGAIYEAVTRNKRTKSTRERIEIQERLMHSHRLIVIDQAHKMTDSAIEYLFDLHDRTGCPVLLIGTAKIGERLSRDRDPRFGQLYSRVSIRCNLVKFATNRHGGDGDRLFTIDEIRKVYNRGKVRLTSGAAKLLMEWANTLGYGSLRLCSRVMYWAEKRARKSARASRDEVVTVSDEDVERAYAMLNDDDGIIVRRSQQDQSRPLAATG